MSQYIGGSDAQSELNKISNMVGDIQPIQLNEYKARIKKACSLMEKNSIEAFYINAGTNLYYFTGIKWWPSERMVGAVLYQDGTLEYIAPHFEIGTIEGYMRIEANIASWHEHESPYLLFSQMMERKGLKQGTIALDESMGFFHFTGLKENLVNFNLIDAKVISAGCRMFKSKNEIALLQRAKDITLKVHQAASKILREGISTTEVTEFIQAAHRKAGTSGNTFCIVLFGQDSAFPHGVKRPKNLEKNDMVLIDTGCLVEGYNSDITRTYVYGDINEEQRKIWDIEKEAQRIAFETAKIGVACKEVDHAVRNYLKEVGLGPDYDLPGLPHRTGHGTGLDIHEWPYLVGNEDTILAKGMSFSNEPMICMPGKFGIRLEDHFYMGDEQAHWFTEPSHSIDNPFGE